MNGLNALLPAIEIETGDHPRFAVIWLHGLGADGSDFVPVVPEPTAPELLLRLAPPEAPSVGK